MDNPQHNHAPGAMHPPPSPRLAPVDNAHFNHPASQLGSTSTGAAEPALPPPHAEPGQQLTIREKLSASTLLAPVYMLEDLVLDLYDRSTNNDVNGISTTITAVSTAYFIMDTLLISTTKFRPWRAGEEVCRFDAEGNEVTIEEPVGIFEDTIMVDHELVQRFLRCGKCKKDVDITGNRFGECEYHPGVLQETVDGGKQWSCCKKMEADGVEYCMVGRHYHQMTIDPNEPFHSWDSQ